MPFNLGPGEILLLAIFALILFGPKKLPEFGKALGESISAFKKAIYNQPDNNDSNKEGAPVPPASQNVNHQSATPAPENQASQQTAPIPEVPSESAINGKP